MSFFFLPAFGVAIKDWEKKKTRETERACEVNVEGKWRVRESMRRASERANAESMKKECEERMWRVSEERMWRVSEERMWGVYGECVWVKEECMWCVWERWVWRVYVRVKGEHTEVCMSVRVQERKSAQEKGGVHKRMQCVQPQAASEWERKTAENEGEERETLSLEKLPVSLYPKSNLYIFIMRLLDIPAFS